jgi:ribokinase
MTLTTSAGSKTAGKPRIVVAGSSNTDMVIRSPRIPEPGETILGGEFFMNAGGKGANQAVAAARLGGDILFIAKLGDDIFGRQALALFTTEGIDVSQIIIDMEHPSGVALITVDAAGENSIVVASGANAALGPDDIGPCTQHIEEAFIVLMQLETPVPTIEKIASIAAGRHIMTVLNPAPAAELSDSLLRHISIITPNQKETEMLTGIKVQDRASALQASERLHARGVETVIITMGAAGASLYHKNRFSTIASPVVKAVDTTAAGDVFNGALVVGLAEGMEMEEAVGFACRAAALSVTRPGAQASAPYRKELE